MPNFECSHPEPSLPQDQLEAYARYGTLYPGYV